MSDFKKEAIEWIKTIIFSILLAFVITVFITPTIVRGQSMYPTLDNNDYLIINKTAYWFNKPSRGDIVVFKSNIKDDRGKNKDLVKRVIALEGDHLVIKDGQVFINDNLQEENYINGDFTDGDIDMTIPEGDVFVMGDNRGNSYDSRAAEIGPVDVKKAMIGKVVIRLYPFNKINMF